MALNPQLYIRSFLHQTTTSSARLMINPSCISVLFYIKPQLGKYAGMTASVVYPFFSTSNHNPQGALHLRQLVVYPFFFYIKPQLVISSDDKPASCISVLFLHQTTTIKVVSILSQRLYIRSFLHQTTTNQLTNGTKQMLYIRSFSTSNHNLALMLK